MGVCSCIEDYTIVGETHFLHLVYQLALDIALVILQFHVGKAAFQFWEV